MNVTKECAKCFEIKSVAEFHKRKSRPDGLYNYCKLCKYADDKITYEKTKKQRLVKVKQYYNDNREVILKKHLENSETRKIKSKEWRENNKDKARETNREWRYANRTRVNQNKARYRKENQEKINTNYKEWLNNSPTAKIAKRCRNRLGDFLKDRGYTKNKKFLDVIGCTFEQLKLHLESQFKEGMNWDNYGYRGWHVDHIVALATANTEEEVYKLCHYTNLQPLWAIDNLKKNKY